MLILSRLADARTMLIRCGAMSLVEMLITLSVTAIIFSMGMPSLANWMHASDVRSSASDLVAALQGARAEALARNQEVRITLGDAHGHALWTTGCVTISASCPPQLRRVTAPAGNPARWGASTGAQAPALSTPLTAGMGLPAQVTFNALGAAPAVGSGSEIRRIDITHAADKADATVRRLVVLLAANGMVRLCDPLIAAGGDMACD